LAFDAMNKGGNAACILNAANEVVVDAFLKDKVGFLQMSDLIEYTLQKSTFVANPTLNDFIASDAEARKITTDNIKYND
jgi:1-deoxy-D-xylulose-5-phosphate reductoisomerase